MNCPATLMERQGEYEPCPNAWPCPAHTPAWQTAALGAWETDRAERVLLQIKQERIPVRQAERRAFNTLRDALSSLDIPFPGAIQRREDWAPADDPGGYGAEIDGVWFQPRSTSGLRVVWTCPRCDHGASPSVLTRAELGGVLRAITAHAEACALRASEPVPF